jgi:hypothetical protein
MQHIRTPGAAVSHIRSIRVLMATIRSQVGVSYELLILFEMARQSCVKLYISSQHICKMPSIIYIVQMGMISRIQSTHLEAQGTNLHPSEYKRIYARGSLYYTLYNRRILHRVFNHRLHCLKHKQAQSLLLL